MTSRLGLLGSFLLGFTLAVAAEPAGAARTGQYRNLFREYLGRTEAETDAKIGAAWNHFFLGDEKSQRLFYPVAEGMAYIPDVNNNDVRTEGLSYGMMICVQLNHQSEFNQLWKFAKRHMYYERGKFRGYFAWHTALNGDRLGEAGPASDGEEWFVMALFFASHRWGDGGGGIFNYGAEAQALLRTMLHKDDDPERGDVTSMFHREARQINFVPHGPGANFTDPSYHVPAFSELWARWAAAPADRAFLAELAPVSRGLFKRAAHPRTGLMPDYSGFDGRPVGRPGHDDFAYDAWRTLSNPALDYAWWAADPWAVEQSNRVLAFLLSQDPSCASVFKLDGTPMGGGVNSPGLTAMAATAALAADRKFGEPFVRRLWELEFPEGRYRYYNGLLQTLALLEVGGRFRVYGPRAEK